MPLVSEMVHPRGFSFAMQRRIVCLRDVHGETWDAIADQVKNLQGQKPLPRLVASYYRKFSVRDGRAVSKYQHCGNKIQKATTEAKEFLLRTLLEQRRRCVCTSTTLQQALAREKGVHLSPSWIRKILQKKGYRWLPKRQKRKYSPEVQAERLTFAKSVVRMSAAQLREKLSFAMDGVILTMPPTDPTDRFNYCRHGDDHMWRKPSESFSPDLAGDDSYGNQAPLGRVVPLWGGCSAGGFAIAAIHKKKKLTAREWSDVVTSGKLRKAVQALKPTKKNGPWHILCDNESFLRARVSRRAHSRAKMNLWDLPARSPDLNPVELVWAWLRKKLRAMDLADAVAKRPVLGKTAYVARVRRVLKTKKAQLVAASCAKGLKKVCREVVRKKGAGSSC